MIAAGFGAGGGVETIGLGEAATGGGDGGVCLTGWTGTAATGAGAGADTDATT